jgi:hypothetical protein
MQTRGCLKIWIWKERDVSVPVSRALRSAKRRKEKRPADAGRF